MENSENNVLFWFVVSEDDKGRRIYAQFLESSKGSDYGYTYHADFAKRFTDVVEAKKFHIDLKYSNSFLNKKYWDIIGHNMEVDQKSWAHKPEKIEIYEDVALKKFDRVTSEKLKEYERKKRKNSLESKSSSNANK